MVSSFIWFAYLTYMFLNLIISETNADICKWEMAFSFFYGIHS